MEVKEGVEIIEIERKKRERTSGPDTKSNNPEAKQTKIAKYRPQDNFNWTKRVGREWELGGRERVWTFFHRRGFERKSDSGWIGRQTPLIEPSCSISFDSNSRLRLFALSHSFSLLCSFQPPDTLFSVSLSSLLFFFQIIKLFDTRIQFGTSGLRARMRMGPNGMNDLVVQQTSQGFARYLLSQEEYARERGIVVGFDTRHKFCIKLYFFLFESCLLIHFVRIDPRNLRESLLQYLLL